VHQGSPVNRTEAALMGRGIDSTMAARLRCKRWTLGKLKTASDRKLKNLGLSGRIVASLRMGQRAEIPFDSLAQVLITNRFTCCVCHDPSKSIIVHHIREWSVSHDHSPKNLACLCLEHHDKAHSKSNLSRNLDAKSLRAAKVAWETEVPCVLEDLFTAAEFRIARDILQPSKAAEFTPPTLQKLEQVFSHVVNNYKTVYGPSVPTAT
jgi:hypothetical protein